MKASPPKAYIVISCWKDYQNLVECLDSIKKITYPNYKVVVVYTYPQDGEVETLIQRYGDFAQLINNESDIGFCGNCNLGISYALTHGADYILTLDSDIVVAPNFVEPLVEVAESNPKTGMVQSKIHLYYEPDKLDPSENRHGGLLTQLVPEVSKVLDRLNKKKFNETKSVRAATLTSSLIKRKVFEAVGLLDPIFFYGGEDFDFNFRVAKAGFTRIYCPDSTVYHKHRVTRVRKGKISPFHIYYLARCRPLFVRKHLGLPVYLGYLLLLAVFHVPKSVMINLLVNKNLASVSAYLRGIFDGLTIKIPQKEGGKRA